MQRLVVFSNFNVLYIFFFDWQKKKLLSLKNIGIERFRTYHFAGQLIVHSKLVWSQLRQIETNLNNFRQVSTSFESLNKFGQVLDKFRPILIFLLLLFHLYLPFFWSACGAFQVSLTSMKTNRDQFEQFKTSLDKFGQD